MHTHSTQVQTYTHTLINAFWIFYVHKHTHAFLALAGVWQSCQHQRLAVEGDEGEEEDGEEEACALPSGDWLSPYQRGRAKVKDWWGRSCRIIIKPSEQQFSLSWALSTVSLSLYLVFPVIWTVRQLYSALCGGQREGERVSCQRDCWTGWSICPVFLPSHPSITVIGLPASFGFSSVWVTPGKARET